MSSRVREKTASWVDVEQGDPDPQDQPRESPAPADETQPTWIVVVGASAGGVSALQDLLRNLPADFDGALFVVLHSAPDSPARLPLILARATQLRVAHARDGDPIER